MIDQSETLTITLHFKALIGQSETVRIFQNRWWTNCDIQQETDQSFKRMLKQVHIKHSWNFQINLSFFLQSRGFFFFFLTSKESDFCDLKESSLSRFFTLEYFHSQTKKYLGTWKLNLSNNNQLETWSEFKVWNATSSLIIVDSNNSFLLCE